MNFVVALVLTFCSACNFIKYMMAYRSLSKIKIFIGKCLSMNCCECIPYKG